MLMDLNLTVLAGRLATEPELTTYDSGSTVLRLLVTVRSDKPRQRLDVIPVTMWNPDDDMLKELPKRGDAVWIAGQVQRRFWSASDGRQSRIEIMAHEVVIRNEMEDEYESERSVG